MNKYPLDYIKKAADFLYGSTVSDRAWRKWKRIFYVAAHQKNIDKDTAVMLLTLADLRLRNPRKKYTQVDVKHYLATANYNPNFLEETLDAALYSKVLGKQLPTLIRQVTGRKVTIRTIYRWSKSHRLEFKASKIIPRHEVEEWLKIAC